MTQYVVRKLVRQRDRKLVVALDEVEQAARNDDVRTVGKGVELRRIGEARAHRATRNRDQRHIQTASFAQDVEPGRAILEMRFELTPACQH
jgi:hypothetical protein